jgi:HTH-type transcriptional regulator / antitoxin HigA
MRTLRDNNLTAFIAPRTDAEYGVAVNLLNELVDEVGDHPEDPRYRLIETLSTLIEAYDDEHHQIPDVGGVGALRFLMDQHGLTQMDLKEELGGQSVVSDVLSGKRELNLHQIRALAKRFSIDPAVFI